MDGSAEKSLEDRIGRTHLKMRLGIEGPPQRVFGGGLNFLHLENSLSVHRLLKLLLVLSGLYGRGNRNARDIEITRREMAIPGLPDAFVGAQVLHLSDLHLDMDEKARSSFLESLVDLEHDYCFLTGDYRASTSGPVEQLYPLFESLVRYLKQPSFAVLGNHDSIRMVPMLESLGIRFLLNESTPLERQGQQLYLAGVDDAHYFRADNLHKATDAIPPQACSILLSHTPEIYRQASHAGFAAMFCGHTHGGQICLPGGIPVIIEAHCPRAMGRSAWQYCGMQGYTSRGVGTSILPVRFNCRPEITIHRLVVGSSV